MQHGQNFHCYFASSIAKSSPSLSGEKHYQIKQTEANVLKTVEKRSLLPRMIYLSIHSASVSVKENVEANRSFVNPSFSLELNILLERSAKILEFPFEDAVEIVLGVSSGRKPLEALSTAVVDWMNFAVFFNAWNLNSCEIRLSEKTVLALVLGSWHLVNSLTKKYLLEKIGSTGSLISSPGSDFPILVKLVTEPLAWHGLIIQSCVVDL
ncbi:unnamed protein product [Fraxinus pennsylvanica]|uniref:Uncharacterized protein n=1 Tax=Fraxinus pennsylvanica TaxID=56036 RepID=A0AAD1ZVQ9_9LAMI|nr:unnamed protein product [Fraxinus pennsylvanica]